MIKQRHSLPGIFTAGFIFIFVVAALAGLLFQTSSFNPAFIWQDPYIRHLTRFSFYQAFLSTIISVVLALPVAHALSRRNFFGKTLLLKLFATTLVLPVLVGVFGLLAIYGNSGLISDLLNYFDLPLSFSIYGINGILLAHVFFNLPFAARLLLQSLQSIPEEHHKLSAHLGISHWNKFKLIEWPLLRQQLPHICGLIFMLCFTSFATVMALGGGPKSTTIELAIYQAIKFDFDLQSGALLALWQMLLCAVLVLSIQRFSKVIPVSSESQKHNFILFSDNKRALLWDTSWIVLVILLVIPPLIMVVISGLNKQFISIVTGWHFWSALGNSFLVAACAAILAIVSGILILMSSRCWRLNGFNFRADKLELIGTIILVTPGIVISTGVFLLLRNFTNIFDFALVIVIVVNALMALPYVIKTLAQPMLHIAQQYNLLACSLGMSGWSRFYLIEWKAIKRPIINAYAISFVLSIGDLSAIALFGSQDFKTLPLYLFQLLGSYQMEAAAVVSLFLLFISVGAFALMEKIMINNK